MTKLSSLMRLSVLRHWQELRSPAFTVFQFIADEVPLSHALTMSRLVWPHFIEVDGCVVNEDLYDAPTFRAWWMQFHGDRGKVEEMTNLVHLWDLFDEDPSEASDAFDELLAVMATAWQQALVHSFPGRRFHVEAELKEGEYGPTITFWGAPPG